MILVVLRVEKTRDSGEVVGPLSLCLVRDSQILIFAETSEYEWSA